MTRFELAFNYEKDTWELYDTQENKYYDINISTLQKKIERLERTINVLHEKYEEMEKETKELKSNWNTLKSNEDVAYRVYLNLKKIYENE